MEQVQLSKIFKALSNEQRLNLFKKIHQWQKNSVNQDQDLEACGIEKAFTRACGCMAISRSTISHHLKELQNAGLIICTRQGKFMSVRINPEALDKIREFIG